MATRIIAKCSTQSFRVDDALFFLVPYLALTLMPFDPLQYGFPLPLTRTYFPMGFPVRITTNSEEVIRAAEEVWGCCEELFGGAPLELRFAIDGDSTAERPPAGILRGNENLLAIVHSADNFAMADLSRGSSFSWLTPAMVSEHGYFRYHFLEALTYVMLGALYLTPIHAACVALNGSGVLLCGDSGAGKTSLAYTCARRGWTYVADDASHLLRPGAELRILGRPHEIRFRSTAAQLFPELAVYPPVKRANGKLDLEIKTSELGFRHTAMEVCAGYLVFPNRDFTGPAGVRAMERSRAEEWLFEVLCVGEEEVRVAQRKSLAMLLELPILELCYRDPAEGEAQLRALVTQAS
jgi:hypothetical protein